MLFALNDKRLGVNTPSTNNFGGGDSRPGVNIA